MIDIICKRRDASSFKKNGIVHGHQRYHCHNCGCDFTMTPPRGKPPAMKAPATLLYTMGNMSFCSIARLLGVSDVSAVSVPLPLEWKSSSQFVATRHGKPLKQSFASDCLSTLASDQAAGADGEDLKAHGISSSMRDCGWPSGRDQERPPSSLPRE